MGDESRIRRVSVNVSESFAVFDIQTLSPESLRLLDVHAAQTRMAEFGGGFPCHTIADEQEFLSSGLGVERLIRLACLEFGADIWREELIQALMRPGDGDAPIAVSRFGLSVNENIRNPVLALKTTRDFLLLDGHVMCSQ
jgi:hypothetical protein